MDRDQWDERYRSTKQLWSVAPNQFVASELAGLATGRALDLAAGEGRNAVWLASQGWRVTAVEFSEVAIERGRALAAKNGVEVTWVDADLLEYVPEAGGFDLVVLSYLQLVWPSMETVLARAAEAVAPGGTLFLIAHDSENLEGGYGGPRSASALYTPEQVAGALGALTIERAETVQRIVQTDDGPRTALDCLVRATRPGA